MILLIYEGGGEVAVAALEGHADFDGDCAVLSFVAGRADGVEGNGGHRVCGFSVQNS